MLKRIVKLLILLLKKGNRMALIDLLERLVSSLERFVVSQEKMSEAYQKSVGVTAEHIFEHAMNEIVDNRSAATPPEGAPGMVPPDPSIVPPATGPAVPGPEFPNYETMELGQLKELASQRGIPQKSGTRKSTYVKALQKFDAAAAAGTSPETAGTAVVTGGPTEAPDPANPFAGQATGPTGATGPAAVDQINAGINPLTGEPIPQSPETGTVDAPNPFGLTDKVTVNGVNYPTFIPHTRSEVDAAAGKFYSGRGQKDGGEKGTLALLQKIMIESTGANMIAAIPQEKYHDFIIALENYKD